MILNCKSISLCCRIRPTNNISNDQREKQKWRDIAEGSSTSCGSNDIRVFVPFSLQRPFLLHSIESYCPPTRQVTTVRLWMAKAQFISLWLFFLFIIKKFILYHIKASLPLALLYHIYFIICENRRGCITARYKKQFYSILFATYKDEYMINVLPTAKFYLKKNRITYRIGSGEIDSKTPSPGTE